MQGAESDWRTANSISIKETFSEENGYDLIFEDAKQKQENRIMAPLHLAITVKHSMRYSNISEFQ